MRALGKPISGPLLQEKALLLNALGDGPADFKASNGWLDRWKTRYGIRQLTIQGEKLSADEDASTNFCQALRDFIRENNYKMNEVYNADESGLMWKQLPRKTLVSHSEKTATGRKLAKDRITIMVSANASGTHKIPLLVIGSSKKPRCFKKTDRLPIIYKGQKKAWMDRQLFLEWYVEVFLPELEKKHGPNARCLLLLDNAPSHPPADELNAISELCCMMYLPPNVTSLIQPMDQGVIEKAKRLFRRNMLKQLLLANDTANMAEFFKTWTILDACSGIALAWNGVTAGNIKNSFNKLLGGTDEYFHDDSVDPGNLTRMVNQLLQYNDVAESQVLDWLQDDNDPGWQIMDDAELLALARGTDAEDSDGEVADDHNDNNIQKQQKEKISAEKALEGLQMFKEWYTNSWEGKGETILAIEENASILRDVILFEKYKL